jgi:hypothetical protein
MKGPWPQQLHKAWGYALKMQAGSREHFHEPAHAPISLSTLVSEYLRLWFISIPGKEKVKSH